MKHPKSIKRLGAAALAVSLCAAVGVGTTFAYYTDATSAVGSLPYRAGTFTPSSDIQESLEGTNKTISVVNTGGAPILVRMKVLYAQSNATVTVGSVGAGWHRGDDGWFYYDQPLWNQGDATTALVAAVEPLTGDNVMSEFNVTVIQQCAPVVWDQAQPASTEGEQAAEADKGSYSAVFAGNVVIRTDALNNPVRAGELISGIGRANVTGQDLAESEAAVPEAAEDAADQLSAEEGSN